MVLRLATDDAPRHRLSNPIRVFFVKVATFLTFGNFIRESHVSVRENCRVTATLQKMARFFIRIGKFADNFVASNWRFEVGYATSSLCDCFVYLGRETATKLLDFCGLKNLLFIFTRGLRWFRRRHRWIRSSLLHFYLFLSSKTNLYRYIYVL